MSLETRDPVYDIETEALEHRSISTSGAETIAKPCESESESLAGVNPFQSQSEGSHFVCTFCWQPQYPPRKPKLVGSARISCSACWKEVLDLSICWVCGEQVVRGEEVVSLGWCFWHAVCFGCLLCGSALPVPEAFVDVEQGKCDGKGKGKEKEKRKRKRKERGVELESIPLCVNCGVEMEGKSEERILERGLETVGRFDGGLSRSRLMRISEATEKEREADGFSLRWVSPLVSKGCAGHKDRKSSKLGRKRSHNTGVEEIPLMVGSMSWESIDEDASVDPPSQGNRDGTYVSVLNPLGEPAFRPSKTKPLPKWMSLLPSNRKQKSKFCPPGRQSHSIASPSKLIWDPILEFPAPEPEQTPFAETLYPSIKPNPELPPRLSTNIDEVILPKPSSGQIKSLERRPAPASPKTGKSLLEVILPPRPAPEQIQSLTKRPAPTFPILRNKALSVSSKRKNPFVRAGSTGNPFVRTASIGSSVYFSPLEKPATKAPPQMNIKRPEAKKELTSFPFFQNARQPITPAKDSSWSPGLPSSGLSPFKGTPLETPISKIHVQAGIPPRPPSRRSSKAHSAEFLARYQPMTPPAVAKEKYKAGEVGNIIEKFESRKLSLRERGKDVLERVDEETGEGLGDRSGVDKIRDGLRKELKSLFDGK